MSALGVVAGSVAALGGAIALFQFAGRFIYGYALTATHFEVRLLGLVPIFRIALRNVTGVAAWRRSRAGIATIFTRLNFGNRIFGEAVAIECSGHFPRSVVVTPDDPACLLNDLRARLAKAAEPRASIHA